MGEQLGVELSMERVLRFYEREDIQEQLLRAAQDREIGVLYMNGKFGKRPDTIQYPSDILQLVKSGVVSFNISEERWSNPLLLEPGMSQQELDSLRTGWDIILDIDGKTLEYSRHCADLIVRLLNFYACPFSIKFSGRAGFHLAIPFEAFSDKYFIANKELKNIFPDAPKAVATYIATQIEQKLAMSLLSLFDNNIATLVKKTGLDKKDLVKENTINPFLLVDIDNVALSSRHLIRSPYSINPKSGLVSCPVDPKDIMSFDTKYARMETLRVDSEYHFFNRFVAQGVGDSLLRDALDHAAKKAQEEKERSAALFSGNSSTLSAQKGEVWVPDEAIAEMFFPEPIKFLLGPLQDGRKRALFILTNFFRSVGWSWEQMHERLHAWNTQLPEPLRSRDIDFQLQYAKKKNQIILPPNIDHPGYYKDIGVPIVENSCGPTKNPALFAQQRYKEHQKNKPKTKKSAKKKQEKEPKPQEAAKTNENEQKNSQKENDES